MPDILIRMEMPKRCEDCMCYRREISHAYCTISSVNVLGHGNARLDNCPIVELPPHGDLIDLSELQKFPIRLDHYDKEHGDEHFVYGIESLMEYAECLPVVVPAEREGET